MIDAVVDDLVSAGRILYHHRVVDAFGHVSARVPGHRDRFLLSRRVAPAAARHEDILEYGLDGEPMTADAPGGFLERYIHAAIYAARPDVTSVVHSHSSAVTTFSILKNVPLRAACHTGRFLGTRVPVFEIRDVAGDGSDLMITDMERGDALARALGDAHVVLMRGHGSTVVGGSVQEAVLRAIYTETNAKILMGALAIGEVEYLSEGETAQMASVPLAIERTWQFWKSEAV